MRKTLCRLIAPKWLLAQDAQAKRAIEGLFTTEEICEYNAQGYNIYFRPNYPKNYHGGNVDGTHIDTFEWVFVDCDTKDGAYTKDTFLVALSTFALLPTKIVDSGNGIHAYWRVTDLDAMSFLRLSRRLMRALNTDPAVVTLPQLMRLPETINTKREGQPVLCETLLEQPLEYTCEELDKALPAISIEDEAYCREHFDRTHNINQEVISEVMPAKWGQLLLKSNEVKELWTGTAEDRSKNDFRLGHIMFANGFTKAEAASVLANSAKASQRAPKHRHAYATNIVDKIWTFEVPDAETPAEELSLSIKDILTKGGSEIKGTPFRCHKRIDNTEHGFRLGQVIGLVAGSGVGKTAFSLNMFHWFAQENPSYHHFFVPLEQPANEIADRWQTMCDGDTSLHDKIHVISNYDEKGNFRHLSLDEIREYIEAWKAKTGFEVGCIVIDHIGALKKKGAKDENQDLMTICHSMKAFAIQTNTLLVMQSQSSREKAGIGDLELNKDAAYGTMFFEAYCDYLITLWQPLKRCHAEHNCPTVTAFKFCKIRHKKAKKDVILEDVPYFMYFDSEKERLRDMTQDEKTAFHFYLPNATNKRKADRKTELVEYKSVPYNSQQEALNVEPIATVKDTADRTRH